MLGKKSIIFVCLWVAGFTLVGQAQDPNAAHSPNPADGQTINETEGIILSWAPGEGAVLHTVYFSTDRALVEARDPNVAANWLADAWFEPGVLEPDTTYYWSVDEMMDGGAYAEGPIWSFAVALKNDAITNWEATVAAATPAFLATQVEDGIYDVNVAGGEITYEFVVNSNPDEEEASMALMGRRGFGDTSVGLKFEQWPDSGFGATVFGVADHYYDVNNIPGEDVHIVFASSETAGTTSLYVNGEYQGEIPAAITLSGLVGIGYAAAAEDGSDFFDNFDGDIFGVAVYGEVLSDEDIAAHAKAFFKPTMAVDNWLAAEIAVDPAFAATYVEDGVYDVNVVGGEISYEFIVRSNPDEEEASMALMGRRDYGDTSVGLKFEQWPDSGFGATVFGVADHYYDVNNIPDENVHIVFVSSETAGTTSLYVNGEYQGEIPAAITLSGLVGIGYAAAAEDGSESFDNFDGDIFGVAIYDAILSDEDIATRAKAFLAPSAAVAKWEMATATDEPAYLDTFVADGVYDVNVAGGEITYEFIVRSNPDEEQASMGLMGRRGFGDSSFGLKYEQWPDAGYGATEFGVVDYYFEVDKAPGEDTQVVFVSSEAAATTSLYVNGVYQAEIPTAITLSGLVGIGYIADAEDGSAFFDNFDGELFGVAVYGAVLSDEAIAAHAEAFLK